MKTNLQVDTYIATLKKWQKEIQSLRSTLLDCGLSEEFKWKKACYSYEGSNLFIIAPLKESCTLNFFNGALLKDSKHILTKP